MPEHLNTPDEDKEQKLFELCAQFKNLLISINANQEATNERIKKINDLVNDAKSGMNTENFDLYNKTISVIKDNIERINHDVELKKQGKEVFIPEVYFTEEEKIKLIEQKHQEILDKIQKLPQHINIKPLREQIEAEIQSLLIAIAHNDIYQEQIGWQMLKSRTSDNLEKLASVLQQINAPDENLNN
ncbi:hypothetical protein C4569_00360 [Candidatus Parcubacteria bacterium]|nr:MAG: hypothetical protein C4569_00360 [Candidatus Parcubacteria bacterium]